MKYKITAVILFLCIYMLALHNLGVVPRPWFDEGWVLSLARNWVVSGHYGHLLQNEPVPSTILNAGLPATAPVALSFHTLGIGIWQGRLPNVFFLMGVCILIYHLAQRLYNRKIAVWTLVVLLLFSMFPDLHPVFMGRQALGEIPAMFFLLAGYALLFASWHKNRWGIVVASLSFGIALQTKPQLFPFFAASLFIPILWLSFRKSWQEVRLLSITLLLAFFASAMVSWGSQLFLDSSFFTSTSGGDAYAMTTDLEVLLTYIAVFDPIYRLNLFKIFIPLLVGFPVILGIVYIGFHQIRHLPQRPVTDFRSTWVLILWIYAFTALCWFYFLSIGFLRYLFPAALIGSMFVAKAIYDLTFGFNFIAVYKSLVQHLHQRSLNTESIKLVLLSLFLLIAFSINLYYLSTLFTYTEDSYTDVLAYLHNETPPTALIETYESELYLLLQRDYHYPPDSLQHVLNKNVHLKQGLPIEYDPTSVGIDYVVIGWSKIWPLYNSLIADGTLELIYKNDNYRVFEVTKAENLTAE